jgi:pSer/pThr/pTyr-binding forkhead associated (FHA) protein
MRIILTRQGRETAHDIARETVLIGRGHGTGAPDLDLSPDNTVSRKHATLTERHGAFWIEDLGSKLGTLVNGEPIQDKGECRLRPGDTVQIGETVLRVERSAEVSSSTPASEPVRADASAEFHIEIALDAREPALAPAPRPGRELEHRLALLVDLPAQFSAQTSLDEVLQLVLRRVVTVIPEAERGAVLLCEAGQNTLLLKACVSPEGPAVSGTLARRALEEGRGFIWRRNLAGSVSGSIVEHQIATGMYVPLRWQNQSLGVICVDSPRITAVFKSDDLRLLLAVAQYAALAVSNHQMQEQLRHRQQLL